MPTDEIALQLTLKAMELGLICKKPLNFFNGPDPFEEATQYAAKQVNDFYEETKKRLLNF